MATETASPYSYFAAKSESGAGEKQSAKALFSYGDEIIARPSATGCYLLPELEADAEVLGLANSFGTASPGAQSVQYLFDQLRGEVSVRIVLPEPAAEQAVSEMLHGSRSFWNLNDFSTWLARCAHAAVQATHGGIAETGRAAAEAARAAVGVVPVDPEASMTLPPDQATSADEVTVTPIPDDASIPQLASRLSELTGLHDDELAQLFLGTGSRERVSREHYQRWRTGRKVNATDGNRRRMWFLVRLFEQLTRSGVGVRDWVRNTTEIDGLTPYELLRLGRFDEVEHLAVRLAPVQECVERLSPEGLPVLPDPGPASFTPRTEEPTTDLVFIDDDDWVEIEENIDDETDDD